MLAKQLSAQNEESQQVSRPTHTEGKEHQSLLYQEILSLRKDLENQRYFEIASDRNDI